MADERILWEAEFNQRVTTYWLLSGALVFVVSVVGIPLLPLWFLFGQLLTKRYLQTYRCSLTTRSLKFERGLFVKVEKTVPLDRITDVGLLQGPIMRYFDIEALSVETAGQSSAGALLRLTGIQEGRKFRDAVLKQRDLVVGSHEDQAAASTNVTQASSPVSSTQQEQILLEIRDTLVRIEEKIEIRHKNESPPTR